MRYFDMFAGIGGFSLGITKAYEAIYNTEVAGLENVRNTESIQGVQSNIESEHGGHIPTCVGYSEIDKYAIQVYERHFNHRNYGDATTINPSDLPDFDLLCGGFPCQAFSVAGKRKGFDDTRGTLFFDIARICAEKRPRYLVLENVKGLLSHDKGKTFQTILGVLSDLGYFVEWQVLNSKNFGVPQNRERVFIIGYLGGEPKRKVFPIGEVNNLHLKEITSGVSDAQRIYKTEGVAKTLKGLGGGLGAKTGLYAIPVLTPDRLEKRQNGRRFKEDGEPAFTLTSQDKHGIYDGARIRRLTPLECERLQGFPDGWTEKGIDVNGNEVYISDTQRYRSLGNAVTVNVVEAIFNNLT